MELILRLQPETRRVVVVAGTAEVDRMTLSRAKEAARPFTDRARFDFWSDRSMAEVRQAVKALPPQTAILLTRMYRDAAGEAFIPPQAARLIAEASNAPLYVLGAASVGGGAVGGSVTDATTLGKKAGELAARILDSPPSTSFPFEVRTTGVPMFDWRVLKRWGISESRLPPGSVVRFRPISIWEQYSRYITGAILIIAVQSLLILGLLLQRRRRRRAEKELRESREFLEVSTSAGELGLWVRDMERGDLWTNQRLRSLFGFGQNETVRFDNVLARIHPDDRGQVTSTVQEAQERALPFETEFRVLNNGTERWVAAKGRVAGDSQGHPRRRMGMVFDITERKQTEERVRRVLEAAPNAMIMVDQEGKILLINGAVEAAFGYARSEMIGHPIEMLVPDRFRAQHPGHRQNYFADPQVRAMGAGRELFGRRKDGSEVPVEIGLTPIRTSEGLFVLASIIDITARKESELAAQRHRDELAHAGRVSVMGQLASALAHELNQPLGAILRNAEAAELFLQANPPDLQEVSAILADIRKDDQRAGEVIDRMRALLKRRESQWSDIDINVLTGEVAGLVRPDAERRKINLALDLAPTVPPMRGDAVQLQQVLLNLLLNAMDAVNDRAPEERHISVRTRTADGHVEIVVSDAGHGIAPENLKRLFEPFFTTKPNGMGMGLAISQSIIGVHGGHIAANNNPDGGATFRITLPTSGEGRGTGDERWGSSDG